MSLRQLYTTFIFFFGILLSTASNAAIMDTVQISSSGIVIGGGTRPGNLSSLFQIPNGSTVDGFTVTLLDSSAFNPQLELVQTFSPFKIGVINVFGVNNPVFLTSGSGAPYDIMLGLIDGTSTPFPEAIRVSFPNDGQTSFKFADFEISATGELATVPLPPTVLLFSTALIGLIGLSRQK